jgi:hypothetical protein
MELGFPESLRSFDAEENLKMVGNRILTLAVLFVVLTVGGALMLAGCGSAPQQDSSYKQVMPPRDTERRQQPLGSATEDNLLDVTAFVGMPESYSEAASKYVDAVFSAIQAEPIKRQHFYHENRRLPELPLVSSIPYPDGANPVYDRDVIVPLVLLPRPDAVRTWSASAKARSLGWRTEDEVSQRRGSVYGRTLIYEPGKLSKNPKSLPTIPFESEMYSWDLYVEDHDTKFFLELGKLVDKPYYDYDSPHEPLLDRSAVLHLGEKDGAKLLGEFITVPAFLKNSRLRWTSIQKPTGVRRFLAYSLVDGNGARRWIPFDIYKKPTSEKISAYMRPLRCERHQPKIKQHDELLLPTPLGWAPRYSERIDEQSAKEEWCLDDWFPAQKEACWVIREAKDSKPLQESFLLMPAIEPSNQPVFFIALFAETEPKQLVQELATLYKVSPDAILNSSDTMERLTALYERLRDFPLAN